MVRDNSVKMDVVGHLQSLFNLEQLRIKDASDLRFNWSVAPGVRRIGGS